MDSGLQQNCLIKAHSRGVPLIVEAKIVGQWGNYINDTHPIALGQQLANLVLSNNLDGMDISIRDFGTGFTLGSKDSAASVNWVIDFTKAVRQVLGPNKIIMHSPLPNNFGPINVNTVAGPLGGYTSIHKGISNLIQHYNIYYFNLGSCYSDYTSMFVQAPSSCGYLYTSVNELFTYSNVSFNQIVIAKPIIGTMSDVTSGYLNGNQMHAILSEAYAAYNWSTGVMGYVWDPAAAQNSTDWIHSIFPLDGSTSVPSSSPTLSPPPTISPSLSPSSSSSDSALKGICKSGQNYDEHSQKCSCPHGSFVMGSSCQQASVIIVAVIVPIVIIAILVIAIFFFIKKKRYSFSEDNNSKMERLPSKTFSLPDLESSYHSTNLITEYGSITIKKKLGQGGSGVVNLGVWCHIEVAVKEFQNQDIQTTDFIRESEIHAKLRHPNVVQLLAICLPPHMCTISEFMAKGSLADVLEQKPAAFTWKRKMQALHDIAKGMDYLQKSKIIHRDLKSQNCLIDKNWTCKIADFGTSKLVNEMCSTATAYVPRTAQWSAPEVIVRGEYSEKSDVYSYGVIMWECYTGEIPYDGMFAFQVEDRTVRGSRLTIPVGCEAWYEALMQECWSAEPDQRPNFETIITLLEKSAGMNH